LLVYTSGTTGPSKGATLTHANIGYHAVVTPIWLGLDAADSVLTVAPFFHITGLGMHLIEHYTPRFTVGTITAYIALAEHAASAEEGARTALSGMSSAISGGAAVPAAVVDRYEREFGVYIRNGYGLTETASACVIVPFGQRAPVDPGSGATSIGRPLPGVSVSIVADDGSDALPGTGGEVVVRGPQVGTGYWNRPEETANAFQSDGLHTGDIGMIDEDGWIYLVDRKKDLIVVSGYKVWPRDVEDVLYRHPSVTEVAVIGVPDDYRGESVHAFVSLRPGHGVTPEELNRHCRKFLSAYKCPRHYEIVPGLPKSASGKILRRLLRK
jgi:long-chain acyl-CoA synthetase